MPQGPPADFVLPTMKPGCGLTVPEQAQKAVEVAVDDAMKLATSIAQNRAHALGVMAGHRLGEAIARTAAESATKATSHDVVASACREAAGDGMYAVEQAAKTLGLTEDAVLAAKQEVAMGGFQRKCIERVKRLTPIEHAEHTALNLAEAKTKVWVKDEAARRASAAGQAAAVKAVTEMGDALKYDLGRITAWQAHQQMEAASVAARPLMFQVANNASFKVAVHVAKTYPKAFMPDLVRDVVTPIGPRVTAFLDSVALEAVHDTIEETAYEGVRLGTLANAKKETTTGAQRQIFNKAMAVAGQNTQDQVLGTATAAAVATARQLTDPQAFDMMMRLADPAQAMALGIPGVG